MWCIKLLYNCWEKKKTKQKQQQLNLSNKNTLFLQGLIIIRKHDYKAQVPEEITPKADKELKGS